MYPLLQKIKLVILILLLSVSARAHSMTYQELSRFADRLSLADCPRIDNIIDMVENQLRLRRMIDVRPEDLNDHDRNYNALARIIIWNMRINCNR